MLDALERGRMRGMDLPRRRLEGGDVGLIYPYMLLIYLLLMDVTRRSWTSHWRTPGHPAVIITNLR